MNRPAVAQAEHNVRRAIDRFYSGYSELPQFEEVAVEAWDRPLALEALILS